MPLTLTQEITDLVNNSLTSGNPMLFAAVDEKHRPLLSFRGSTQVYSDNALGFWLRNTSGGTVEAIKHNPNVAFMYRSATTPLLKFAGTARIATDPAERKKVFESAPEREQQSDPERKGLAVIVELESVEGVLSFGPKGPNFVKLAR
jgi:general stress protein 26